MHRRRRAQSLRGASLPSVAVSFANFPKYFVSRPILCAWLARKVKNARSGFATSKWNAFFPCSRIWSYALLSLLDFLSGSRGTLSLRANLGMSRLSYSSGIILSSSMSW